ncbi:MAG: glutaredoxin 3 [Paracoccaceae bacterium]
MKPVEIYTSPLCGYCFRAKRLLARKGIAYREINVLGDATAKAEMIARADGRRTVPQIFVDGVGIGGSDELAELERAGKLDGLLAA